MPKRKPSTSSAAELIPDRPTLSSLRNAAADCKACDLWKRGTQTVFGEGRRQAKVMFIGEQPGNEEDLAGKPFVGPAGRFFKMRLKKPASIARKLTSPMSSNISNGNRAANDAFIKNPTPARSLLAVPGSRLKSLSSNQK